jgi:NhaA family Na+:H+ antiporter
LKSGVHPTIAGVLLAFIVPAKSGARIEHPLSRWVSFGIMPLFAFANAGVFISSGDTLVQPLSAGILLGLVIGKQVGITLFCWLAVRFKIAVLPRGVAWKQIYGISCLGGIGFTMSLFISNLAFSDVDLIDVAKLAVLCASVISGALGAVVLIGERDSPKTTKCA